ncbi:hypothetical protein AAKU55_005776, partial [Oxalobacteraceae bacterium GrIS 1.11]
ALATVGAKHDVENLEHAFILEHAAVAAQGQEGGPGRDGERVAGEAAVGAVRAT